MSDVNTWLHRAAASLQSDTLWQDRVSVSQPTYDGGGVVIDVDTERIIAQFIVWPNWAFEASALSVDSSEPLYFDSEHEADVHTLADGWRRFIDAITAAEVGDGPGGRSQAPK